MSSYYKHPFRTFDSRSEGTSQYSGAELQAPAQAENGQQPQTAQGSLLQNQAGAGAVDVGDARSNLFAFLFQGNNAKIVIPAAFIVLSALYFYIYDSVTSYSASGGLSARRHAIGKREAEAEQINDEELSDRAFESSNQRGNWRPPEEGETRSVEEARSKVGFFSRLFCGGLKRSRWCP